MESTVAYSEPSRLAMLAYSLRRIPSRLNDWAVRSMLSAVVRMVGNTNSIAHATRELRANLESKEEGPDKWIAQNLIELLAVFSTQGHSGNSAPWCIGMFKKLASFEPLGPLTGEDGEWMEYADGLFQNNRCSHVFKDGRDGAPYDSDGRIFREPNGCCFTNRDSRVPITFPYTPTREYVDVPADRD